MAAVAVLGIAGTGAIAQGVSFSGSGDLGVKYAGQQKNASDEITMESSFSWVSNFDLAMSASGTTDGGLTFGAGATVKAGNSESTVGASNAYIGGESWKISIGDLDPASDKGKSLGDVGFDGLDVDDVAEDIATGTAADVEVSFSLGAASLAITAGQTDGKPRIKAVPAKYRYNLAFTLTPTDGTATPYIVSIVSETVHKDLAAVTASETYNIDGEQYYIESTNVYRVVGDYRDPENSKADRTTDVDNEKDGVQTDKADVLVGTIPAEESAGEAILVDSIFIAPVVGSPAEKQDSQWAAGVSFDIGATTLGIGIDSEKLMQASISSDLGAFSGKLFYAQQKMNEGETDESKNTGMGVEIGVSAGANTTINAVYAQGKTDYNNASMADVTDKGFGVGVSHGLGGGATLNAGFAKVKKVSKASVGVSMSF